MKTKFLLLTLYLIISGFIMAQHKNTVANSAEEVCPIKIGSEIPDVIVHALEGNEISIRKIIDGRKSIIIFYRGGWCPYCNLHLSELQSIEDDLLKLGYKLIALSMDKPEKLFRSLEKNHLKYELYSDSKANASEEFGVAFKVGDEYVNKLKGFNMDIEAESGERHHILPVPSVFLVDEKGVIKFEYVNPDYKERISGKLLLEVAKQY